METAHQKRCPFWFFQTNFTKVSNAVGLGRIEQCLYQISADINWYQPVYFGDVTEDYQKIHA